MSRFKCLFAVVAMLCVASRAQAAFIVTLQEVGTDVIATGSGSIDTAGLRGTPNSPFYKGLIRPNSATVYIGSVPGANTDFSGISGPSNFGSGPAVNPGSSSGDFAGLYFGSALLLPISYVSGAPLSDTADFNNQTFASLGITPGTYVWTFGSGATADSFTVTAVPEPASLSMLGIAAAVGLQGRRRRHH